MVSGRGLRQGMPLSPYLANLILSDFDKKVIQMGIPMVRYVDDFVMFANSENEAKQYEKFARTELAQIGLELPKLEENGKTKITKNQQSFEFLGMEIYYATNTSTYE